MLFSTAALPIFFNYNPTESALLLAHQKANSETGDTNNVNRCLFCLDLRVFLPNKLPPTHANLVY